MSASQASDRIVVVTGASRGTGWAIAIARGARHATAHAAGRITQLFRSSSSGGGDLATATSPLHGVVDETVEAVCAAGALGIRAMCGHGDGLLVAALFQRVAMDHGRLDILVNNSSMIPGGIVHHQPFWNGPAGIVELPGVGAPASFVASWPAPPLPVAGRAGSPPQARRDLPGKAWA